jgi:hypothetical protein
MLTLFTIHITTNAMITFLGVAASLCYIAWTSTRRGVGNRSEK